MLGILAGLKDIHEVRSNQESGYGRYDLAIIPKNTKELGIIMEFKSINVNKEVLLSCFLVVEQNYLLP